MSNESSLIAARRQAIAIERQEHLDAVKALDDELSELDVAERVITRLMGTSGSVLSEESAPVPDGHFEPSSVLALSAARKPEGTPTMPDMILDILNHRHARGLPGATVGDMKVFIAAKWWPDVTSTEINPIAWRMAKRGQIIKDGAAYSIPANAGNGTPSLSAKLMRNLDRAIAENE